MKSEPSRGTRSKAGRLRRRLRRFADLMHEWLADSGINPYQTAAQFSLDDTGQVCDAIAQIGERTSLTPWQIAQVQVGWSIDLDATGPEVAMHTLSKRPGVYLQPRSRPHRARLDGEEDGWLVEKTWHIHDPIRLVRMVKEISAYRGTPRNLIHHPGKLDGALGASVPHI